MSQHGSPSVPSGDQRGTRRTKVFLPIEVDDAGGAGRRAHVLDISPQGARLHARLASRPGRAVDLMVGGERQAASVVWVKHPNFGVRFTEPLTPERLDHIVAPPSGSSGG